MRWRFCESVDEQYFKRQTLDAMDLVNQNVLYAPSSARRRASAADASEVAGQ